MTACPFLLVPFRERGVDCHRVTSKIEMHENYLISAALLNPFGEFLDGSRKSSWWVVRHG